MLPCRAVRDIRLASSFAAFGFASSARFLGLAAKCLLAMALELEYRNTFIDVKEDFEEMGSSRARAQSSPPGRVRRSSFSLEPPARRTPCAATWAPSPRRQQT